MNVNHTDIAWLLVPIAAVVAPLLAALVQRAILIPLVVFEIGLGIALGPSGLGWVEDGEILNAIAQIGLAALFFMAGNEFDLGTLHGRSGGRAFAWWGVSAAIALAAGLAITQGGQATIIIAIALTGTALGTIMPMLRDTGIGRTPLGRAIVSAGAVGEFAPLIAISVLLSGRQPLAGTLALAIFLAVAAAAFYVSRTSKHHWLRRMVTLTLHTSSQFAIRFVMLLLAALVTLAVLLGIDFLLGAFVAGMLARAVLQGGDPEELKVVEAKLDSVAFGFLVPIFFITTGIGFPLAALLGEPASLALVPIFFAVMLVVRGVAGWFTPGRGTPIGERRTSALFTATSLPLVIAATEIGIAHGVLDKQVAAAMVGAGMLTVLLFPMLALLGRRRIEA